MIATAPLALAVAPARIVVAAGQTAELHVTNRGAHAAAVDVSTAGFALSLRGRARILARAAPVSVSRRQLVLRARTTETVLVMAPRVARPGDRAALVLVSTRRMRARIAVRMRLGVVVLVRGPGRLVHRVVAQAVRGVHGGLELLVRNAGNVSERVSARVRLVRDGTIVARARSSPRELLPRTRGVVSLRYTTRLRGAVRAIVEISDGRRVLRRTFRLRL